MSLKKNLYYQAYVGNYTSEWDLIGSRYRNELPLSPWDAMRYGWESCESILRDETTVANIRKPVPFDNKSIDNHWDVAVIDGAFPECLLGILYGQSIPTIMLNTVKKLLYY